jgi:hypothetical protein
LTADPDTVADIAFATGPGVVPGQERVASK